MSINHVNDSNFSDAVKSGLCVVDFWASWCGPCQMFGPIFESVSEKMPNVKFLKFEVDAANREVPGKYGIRSIPSILIFRNGELAAARSGLQQENDFVSWIKETQGGA